MKISTILIASTFVFAIACSGKKSNSEHGHAHDTESHAHPHDEASEDHGHDDGDHEHGREHHEQEEFTVGSDSVEVETDGTHTHEDGNTHHNY
ncbi:hypothetical protein AAG747_12620 [Rapidithrix thailandica]|uniref:Uncharacterized protein n=1 Tax=Rapidithrix thailandica TaxID=413964 RepID=A0AAW9SCZ7_9BACT